MSRVFAPGDHVTYRSHLEAPVEHGIVTEVRPDWVMVLYRGDVTAKATRPADLMHHAIALLGQPRRRS